MKTTIDFAVLADSYQPSEKSIFLQDLENVKSELFIRLWHRQSQFNFIPIPFTKKNNFGCINGATIWEGATCNVSKAIQAIKDAGITCDLVLMLSRSQKVAGGGGGGQIIIVGVEPHHDTVHTGNIGAHEIYHALTGDYGHTGGFMNESGTHGADGERGTFTKTQFGLINTSLNKIAGLMTSPQPTFTISKAIITGNTVGIYGTATGLVQWADIYFDGVFKWTLMYWGTPERNPEFNPVNGMKSFISSVYPGQHSIRIVVTDINNKTAEASTIITV